MSKSPPDFRMCGQDFKGVLDDVDGVARGGLGRDVLAIITR